MGYYIHNRNLAERRPGLTAQCSRIHRCDGDARGGGGWLFGQGGLEGIFLGDHLLRQDGYT